MKYLSLCSGIEAATVAWHPLGWEAVAYSEIERFPSEVLEHHYPSTPNLGDMTKFKEWSIESNVDVLVGGTPCQSFSVAGLRKGLDDPRGNLMLTYLAIAKQYRPNWLVWENVPGVLSSNGGRDFGSFLGGLAECGYGFAYRVLDAQFFGVAQRRRRVFVVGYLGDWRLAAAVLFERHSLQGHPAPSREKRQGVAASVGAGASSSGWPADISSTLNASFGTKQGLENQHINNDCPMFVPAQAIGFESSRRDGVRLYDGISNTLQAFAGTGGGNSPMVMQPIALAENTIGRQPHNGGNGDGFTDGGPMYTLNATGVHGVAQPIPLNSMNCFRSPDADASTGCGIGEAGEAMFTITKTNSHAVAQPIPFKETADCLTAAYGTKWNGNASADNGSLFVAQPIAFSGQMSNPQTDVDMTQTLQAKNPMAVVAPTLTAANDPSRSPQSSEVTQQVYSVYQSSMAVRRLTPVECERLQGFGDNYTDIKSKGKPTPDGPRYKALGNSMAVPVMAWIGKRIQEVENIK